MREVLGPGTIGCLLLAVMTCMAGCVMPSRESLKEPGWNPTTAASTTTGGAVGRSTLIKPFIPPDRHDSPVEGPVSMGADPRTDAAATPQQLTALQETPLAEAPLTVPLEPTPQPVRWQEPEHQAGFQQSQAVPEASQVARVPEGSVPDAATLPEAWDNSLGTIESSPPPVPQPAPPVSPYRPGAQSTEPRRPVKPEPKLQTPPQSALLQVPVEAKSGSREWEDQRVKSAAFKIAKEFPGVKRGKICYSVKTDEWWVVLYDDIGTVYDVKQYTWNRDQEKLESFLVLKRIGKNRLEEDLSVREADKACEPLGFPQSAP